MQRTMEIVRLAALIIAVACAVAAALSLGGAVSDGLDILTHFTPVWLAGGALALALRLAAGGGGRATLLCAAVAIVIGAGLMAPDLIAAATTRPVSAGGGQTLKVIQFNLWEFNRDPEGSARWVAAQNADIVVCEEAVGRGAAVVLALAARYPYQVSARQPARSPTVIMARAKFSGGELWAGPGSYISGAWATFGTGAAAFTVVGTHLLWPVPPGLQQGQSRNLERDVSSFEHRSLIIAGDFNSTPWSFSLRRQDARLGLERRTRALFTWPVARRGGRIFSPIPFLPIDHVYAGADWQTVSVRRGPVLGSDHFPVVVVLRRAG